jgi:acyl-CoA dehydrogenase
MVPMVRTFKYTPNVLTELTECSEVHMLQLGRNENKRAEVVREKIEEGRRRQLRLLESKGLEKRDLLYIGKVSGSPSKL